MDAPPAIAPVQVHLDTDIGGDIDDLCALALLLGSPNVRLTGVTTVLEDNGRRAGYARYVLDLAGREDVPVAAGADLRLGYCRLNAALPPEDRYWPRRVPPVPGALQTALDLLKRSIDEGATVVGIGPFTNLALLERREPGILRHARVYLMGGHVRPAPPGFPALMDYNVLADPEAAQVVVEQSFEPTLVPIEVTCQTALRGADLPGLRASGQIGRLIAHQAEAFALEHRLDERYGATCAGLPTDLVNFQHDPLACAVGLGWEGVRLESLPSPSGPWRVVTSVDQAAFSRFWLEAVLKAA